MSILKLDSVSAGYPGRKVLYDIDMAVYPGDFIAVIGPNGSGKSTLLSVLSGEIKPESGAAYCKGEDLSRFSAIRRARSFSVVHQSYENLLPFKAEEFAALGYFPRKGFKSYGNLPGKGVEFTVDSAFDLLGISGLKDRKITELSGGERQLVFIARALVQCGDVILLDEPVSNLDPGVTVRIMDMLYELNRKGAAIVTVLHNVNLASDYCKTITAVRDGRILFSGSPDDVLGYDNVEELYSSLFTVVKNPVSGRPFVYSVPGHLISG